MGRFRSHQPFNMYTAAVVLALALGVMGDGDHSHAHAPLRAGRQDALDTYGASADQAAYNDLDSAASDAPGDALSMLEGSIPGVPGLDYPIYAEAPETGFTCDGQVDGGYYADPEAECQVFHICTADGEGGLAKYSFLCPNGTIFNQNYFICDWWFNFDCAEAEALFSKNDEIAAERAAVDASAAASNADASYSAPVVAADEPILDAAADVAVADEALTGYDAPAAYDAPRAGRQRGGRGGIRRQG